MSTKTRTPAELWKKLESLPEEALLTDVYSDEEISDLVRAQGGDPDAIGAAGAAVAKSWLAKDPDRLAWRADAARAKDAMNERTSRARDVTKLAALSRDALLARLAAVDANRGAPIHAAFRKREAAEWSDDELRGLLEQAAMLDALDDDAGTRDKKK
jgi:hypothetical protein